MNRNDVRAGEKVSVEIHMVIEIRPKHDIVDMTGQYAHNYFHKMVENILNEHGIDVIIYLK